MRDVDDKLSRIVQAKWDDAAKPSAPRAGIIDPKQEVIAIMLRLDRPDLANAVSANVSQPDLTITPEVRAELEKFVWANTSSSYRSILRGRRAIIHLAKGQTTMTPLCAMAAGPLLRFAQMKGWKEAIATPGYSSGGSGTFDYETDEVGVKMDYRPPNVEFDVYHPVENIGKRGKKVEAITYRLWHPNGSKVRVAWGPTILSNLKKKKNASLQQVLQIIRSGFIEAEKASIEARDEYPIKAYDPSKSSYKGVDPKLPDSAKALKFENKEGRDISLMFSKPNIRIHSKDDSKRASQGRQRTYIDIHWRYAKQVAKIADDIVKFKGLKLVEKFLAENKVKYNTIMMMEPGWD